LALKINFVLLCHHLPQSSKGADEFETNGMHVRPIGNRFPARAVVEEKLMGKLRSVRAILWS